MFLNYAVIAQKHTFSTNLNILLFHFLIIHCFIDSFLKILFSSIHQLFHSQSIAPTIHIFCTESFLKMGLKMGILGERKGDATIEREEGLMLLEEFYKITKSRKEPRYLDDIPSLV